MFNANVLKALVAFAKVNTSSFVGFPYETEYEKANVVLHLGCNVQRKYEKDLETLREARQFYVDMGDAVYLEAIDEMIVSLENSLTKGIGRNDNYTKQDVYDNLAPNIKQHKETRKLYVFGFVNQKNVTEVKAQRKAVNSRPKTLAKRAIEKRHNLETPKFREYIIDLAHMESVKVKGDRIDLIQAMPVTA
jgi:hypothetical protein